MSKSSTPTHFSGETDHFYDPNFTAEISQRMRVPKRINVDGVCDMPNVNKNDFNAWMPAEKLEMHVPEKIVVAGNDDFGTRTIPREMARDNSIMPPDPGIIRVQTPPRVITIDSVYFPEDAYQPPPAYVEINHRKPHSDADRRLDLSTASVNLNESTTVAEGMSLNEEVVHLRRQLAKLNRRIMSIELENMQRQTRDKVVFAVGLAYFFFKTVLWLSRSN
ncbi:transport and Golgi organization protein 11 isoform X2 [Halyomorpha halys]|uniref:transport and Golgi organization protein 11 isoform X2 n=1 Tax=Halyomorpha halys TaxID=286706 RepID=UPI0006D50FDE|nr:transport and Golgi organization protein 11 isoform X1 [Halyomorpha halys]XP_014284482.1 transport and Golgi organization protein 11 isoform X1 [Halyomorpha halys]XP_014284483.1 transport and Golgi organization protein 11 isoform X2 [Halyomorpha halys]